MKKILLILGLFLGFVSINAQNYVYEFRDQLMVLGDTVLTGGEIYPSVLDDGDTEAWYAADYHYVDYFGSSDTIVDTWNDKSGNEHYLTPQSAAENDWFPSLHGDEMRFTTTTQIEDNDTEFYMTQPFTVYYVLSLSVYTMGDDFIEFENIEWGFGTVTPTGSEEYPHGIYTNDTPTLGEWDVSTGDNLIPVDSLCLVTITFNGPNSTIRVNNNTATTGGGTLTTGATATRMLISHYGTPHVCKEVIVRDVDETEVNEALIRAWLIDKYDL